MDLRLRPYTTDDETAARRAEDIAAAEDSMFLLGLEPEMTWTEFLDSVETQRLGLYPSQYRVRAAQLAATVDGELVGRASIRFELNDFSRPRRSYWLRRAARFSTKGLRHGDSAQSSRESLAPESSIRARCTAPTPTWDRSRPSSDVGEYSMKYSPTIGRTIVASLLDQLTLRVERLQSCCAFRRRSTPPRGRLRVARRK